MLSKATLATAILLLGTAATFAASGQDIFQKGGDGVPACSACHGPNGEGQPALGYPRLAGLSAAYVQEQLKSFAAGTRQNETMAPIGKAISPADGAAVAQYVSGLTPKGATKTEAADAKEIASGRVLAERGDWSKSLPACTQCHGPAGMGVGAAFPKLAGQSSTYIVNQLQAWKKGDRRNGPLSLMAGVANKLDDGEIKAVAAYFASLDPLDPKKSAMAGEQK